MSQSPEMQLQKNELTAYLREIFRLEYKKHSAEQTIQELRDEIKSFEDFPYPPQPYKEKVEKPKKPEKKEYLEYYNGIRWHIALGAVAFFLIMIIGATIFALAFTSPVDELPSNTTIPPAAAACGAISSIVGAVLTTVFSKKWIDERRWKKELARHDERMQDYERKLAEAEANYAVKMEEHQKDCARVDSKNLPRRYARSVRCSTIDQLNRAIDTTNNALKQLYSYDIIHPQYRSFMAIAHLLSYFESGRVDTLKEALNKYDTDLFQGRVLQSLDAISFSQDLTRMAIEENNNLLAGVRTNMNTMIAQGEASQAQQHLAAQNSQAILSSVQNMEFRQTIDMLDRYSRR